MECLCLPPRLEIFIQIMRYTGSPRFVCNDLYELKRLAVSDRDSRKVLSLLFVG
jgi:hypothetical protein